jgi:hypothetical protein
VSPPLGSYGPLGYDLHVATPQRTRAEIADQVWRQCGASREWLNAAIRRIEALEAKYGARYDQPPPAWAVAELDTPLPCCDKPCCKDA